MIICQWMQTTYNCERARSILSWRRATYHGGEHEIKMGEFVPPLLSLCLPTTPAHKRDSPILHLDQSLFSSQPNEYILPSSISQGTAWYAMQHLSPQRTSVVMCIHGMPKLRSFAFHWLNYALETWSSLMDISLSLFEISFELWEASPGMCLPGGKEALHDHIVSSTGRKATSLVTMSLKQRTP